MRCIFHISYCFFFIQPIDNRHYQSSLGSRRISTSEAITSFVFCGNGFLKPEELKNKKIPHGFILRSVCEKDIGYQLS